VTPELDAAIGRLGSAGLRRLADGGADLPEPVRREVAGLAPGEAAAYLRGLAAGYDARAARVQSELVWTGPAVFDVPVRATAQVLTGLVGEARQELILTTYSAKPYPPLTEALRAATARGVSVWAVVETLQGAGSALNGAEPAAAFPAGVQLWTWAFGRRPEGAKMHAKVAIVDERTLLVTSANLTGSGIAANMEAGVVVRGGSAARRAAEHLHALRRDEVLVRI
jgi:phosphatidylserine/phosphatidylglycerophosphate/cardiolipin synthase-like enzyme